MEVMFDMSEFCAGLSESAGRTIAPSSAIVVAQTGADVEHIIAAGSEIRRNG
jgi:hypothetical protein